MKSLKSIYRHLPSDFWIGLLVILALVVRIAWVLYTRYTLDDAFITFRYARQIALGNGFVYNLGERLDGTTSPLFALLLAVWAKITSNVVLGSKILDIVFGVSAIFLVWRTLKSLGRSQAEQISVIILLGLSSKLWLMENEGMELSLVLFLMAASWYAVVHKRFAWAGCLLGLLIWTRVDLFLWPILLVAITLFSDVRASLKIAGTAILTYLPWFVFATLYFGTPIPYTIIAKWVAYIQFNTAPLIDHFLIVVGYLSPFEILTSDKLDELFVGLTLLFAIFQVVRTWRDRRLVILICFVLLEIFRLTVTRLTFSDRYMVPALWATLILVGMGAGGLWDIIKAHQPIIGWFYTIALVLALFIGLQSALPLAVDVQLTQTDSYQDSLMKAGLWLRDNAPVGSRVELEPLGYVGYYSNLTMLDDVGLVTPAVVNLKRQQISGFSYFSYLKPDFLILHCDDALSMQGQLGGQDTGLATQYVRVEQVNPLNFDPNHPPAQEVLPGLARESCYEIWKIN